MYVCIYYVCMCVCKAVRRTTKHDIKHRKYYHVIQHSNSLYYSAPEYRLRNLNWSTSETNKIRIQSVKLKSLRVIVLCDRLDS